jgi:hypothetical protein
MTSYVSADLRRLVESRAERLCEYCLIHASDTYLGCQVDHVIAEKHGGSTVSENLAFACTFCNRAKGSDIGSLASDGQFVGFYNPRIQRWSEHFLFDQVVIESKTPIGEVTAKILGFNAPDRLVERTALQNLGRYPSAEALSHIEKRNQR